MNKFLKYFLITLLAIYFIVVIFISILVIKENDYGITTFGEKHIIVINKDSQNDDYKDGDLVVVKDKKLAEFKNGDEIFLYESGVENLVDITIGKIKEVNLESDPNYITIENDAGYYKEDSILGTYFNKYGCVGKIIRFLESKWVFLFVLIIPSAILLVVELYLIIKRIIINRRNKRLNNEG